MPAPLFEAALARPEKPTSNGIITAAFPPKPKPVTPEALWLWGRLMDFDRAGLLTKEPAAVLLAMTPEMRSDVQVERGGTLENAQLMAAHESPRTTKLYDRTGDEITLDEVERITI